MVITIERGMVMKIVWFEQDCIHEDADIDATFDSITEEDIKAFCDDEYDTHTVCLEYADDKVKIFQAVEDDEGESFKFICIKPRNLV